MINVDADFGQVDDRSSYVIRCTEQVSRRKINLEEKNVGCAVGLKRGYS